VFSTDELGEMLKTLNSLSSVQEVQSYSVRAIEKSSRAKIVKSFIAKYCKKRFGIGAPLM